MLKLDESTTIFQSRGDFGNLDGNICRDGILDQSDGIQSAERGRFETLKKVGEVFVCRESSTQD